MRKAEAVEHGPGAMAWLWLAGTANLTPCVESPLWFAACVSLTAAFASRTRLPASEQNRLPRTPPRLFAVMLRTTLPRSTCSPSRFNDSPSSVRFSTLQMR